MAYRNKTYVAFDGDKDIRYYYLMKAWRDRDDESFNFHDAHDLNTSRDSSQEQSIKANLRVRFSNSRAFVLLVGESTRYLTKFVKWEIEQAIRLDLPIIVVNLNGKRSMDESRCPPTAKEALAMHVSFNQSIIRYSLDNWPDSHRKHRGEQRSGPYYYKDSVYQQLGL